MGGGGIAKWAPVSGSSVICGPLVTSVSPSKIQLTKASENSAGTVSRIFLVNK